MILCLDVGNTQIHGGVYANDELQCSFATPRPQRVPLTRVCFFRSVLRETALIQTPSQIMVCCVVPDLLYSLRACCQKLF